MHNTQELQNSHWACVCVHVVVFVGTGNCLLQVATMQGWNSEMETGHTEICVRV